MISNVNFFRRLGAITYDLFIVFSLILFLDVIAVIVFIGKEDTSGILFYLVTLPAIYYYYVFSWVIRGQTVGMMAWKFKIQTTDNKKLSYTIASKRLVFSWFSFAFFGLGYFYQFIDKENDALHDKISKTKLLMK